MKWYAATILIFSFLLSCNNDNNIPPQIIKPKQMQVIIWEMVKADAFADVLKQKDSIDLLSKISMNLTDTLLALHNTNRQQVENSLKYYSAHPDIFKNILDSINAQQTRKNLADTIKPTKPVKPLLTK